MTLVLHASAVLEVSFLKGSDPVLAMKLHFNAMNCEDSVNKRGLLQQAFSNLCFAQLCPAYGNTMQHDLIICLQSISSVLLPLLDSFRPQMQGHSAIVRAPVDSGREGALIEVLSELNNARRQIE